MESLILSRPKVNITPKITKINSLVDSSNQIRKTSTKLRKVFQKGNYQKKTQLSILNRYKKRLESIQNQNDRKFSKKQNVKIKLPEIKKFAGSFFTAGSANDPLKAIGALAAFNALRRGVKGDIGAIGPALVAAGIFFGPSLLRGGLRRLMGRSGSAQPQASMPSGGGRFWGTPYSQTGAGRSYSAMQSERNLPRWAQRLSAGSASRYAASNERMFQGRANIGDRARLLSRKAGFGGVGGMTQSILTRGGGSAAGGVTRSGGAVAAKLGGVGTRAIPLLGTALSIGLSAYRFSQGDVVGGILSAVSAIPVIGWAALAVDLAREFGAFDGTILGRKEQDRLRQQTEEQKRLIERSRKGGNLTFGKTLNTYERVVDKFEEFANNFKLYGDGEFDEPPMPEPTSISPGAGYNGPISGSTFFPLPGGDVGTQGRVSPAQAFGGYREGRSEGHQGLDMTHWQGALDAPVSAYKTGKVVAAVNAGYNGFVELDHGDGLRTLYYHTIPMVRVGEIVYGGQQIARLFPAGSSTHLHFGMSMNGVYFDPLSYVKSVKNRITSPVPRDRAMQHHQEQTASQTPRPTLESSSEQVSTVPTTPSSIIANADFAQPMSRNSGYVASSQLTTTVEYVDVPQPTTRSIESYDLASGRGSQTITVPVPVPILRQPQSTTQPSSNEIIVAQSELQTLNTYYKEVLFTTIST